MYNERTFVFEEEIIFRSQVIYIFVFLMNVGTPKSVTSS